MAQTAIPDPTGEFSFLDKLIRPMDRHLIYPLLDHALNAPDVSPERQKDVRLAIYRLLQPTKMVDYVSQLYQDLPDARNTVGPPPQFDQQREQILEQNNQATKDTEYILGLLETDDVTSQLRSDKGANFKFLEESHNVTQKMIDDVYKLGRIKYEMGDYPNAADCLYRFRILAIDNDMIYKCTWGKLVCEILAEEWANAVEEIEKTRELIDTRFFAQARAQLTARQSLIHYALFPLFNYDAGRDKIIELFFQPAFISTIQTICPWILRYLAAAVITNRSRSNNSHTYQKQLKELIRVVKQEAYEYEDAVTQFVKALYIDFDFAEAQKKMSEAEQILVNDFFLGSSTDAFVESARHLISESYCKIHQQIQIK
jgi:translation initiation factor 3 subunit E